MNESQLFQTAYSPLPSYLPKTKRKSFPILYIIADKQYNKTALLNKSIDPSKELWNEIIEHEDNKSIRKVLYRWINKSKNIKKDYQENDDEIKNEFQRINPLRIVMHELRRSKLSKIDIKNIRKSDKNEIDVDSKCLYFALIWIPNNDKTGFNKHEYNELITAFTECDYICKPLNKHCIYIDGPEYNWEEFKSFNLAWKCNHYSAETENIKLTYTVIVHEMSVGSIENKDIYHDDIKPNVSSKINPTLSGIEEQDEDEKDMDMDDEKNQIKTQIELQNDIQLSCNNKNISQSIQYQEEPLSRQRRMSEIKASQYSILKGTFRCFAFVWIELDDLDISKQELIQKKKTNLYPVQTTMPSYAVMKRLHKQPTEENPEILYNVELMAYDNCWDNLDLVVDRKFQYKDFILLLIQFMFLPFFVLIPIRCCLKPNKREFMKARFRPSADGWICCGEKEGNNNKKKEAISYFNLDKTEQLPFDITILWRAIPKETEFKWWPNEICFRFWLFIITLFAWFVIISGPILYHVYNPSIPERENKRISHVDKLQFFDCWGPVIMYILFVFTVIWWSCASRILIGPKQHLLLYHKLLLHRPVSHENRELNRTDWGALVNLHEPLPETLFTFSYKKEFLLVQRPTDQLIDRIMMKTYTWPCCRKCCYFNDDDTDKEEKEKGVLLCCKTSKDENIAIKIYCKYILIFIVILIYVGLENLENFEYANYPFYIGTADSHWIGLTAYNVVSACVQSMFLLGFILLWESMIFRIYGHLNSVKTLSQMIIRDTYTEYIEFDHIDNILSWLTLENFVKRKGMTLFCSVETPLLSLGVLAVTSWSAIFYCIVQGVGLKLKTDNSMFSNSALLTWLYLGILAFIYTLRMIYVGSRYNRETIKQSQAIKRQCRTENKLNLTHFLNKDQLSIEQYIAQRSCELLLQHVEHSEIVPRVFGIQFDDLLAKAFITALISILPTIISYIVQRIR